MLTLYGVKNKTDKYQLRGFIVVKAIESVHLK